MYLDPGTGSVILQAVIAAFLGVGVLTKIYWKKIKGIFGKKEITESVEEIKEEEK